MTSLRYVTGAAVVLAFGLGTFMPSPTAYGQVAAPATERIKVAEAKKKKKPSGKKPYDKKSDLPGDKPAESDIRLKRDIAEVGLRADGLRLYRYRYLWSETEYVGVMAQEVLGVAPEAVVRGDDGFLRVDYGRLGTRLMTWDEWKRARQAKLGAAR
jgi:hypothetical protein